VVCDRCVFDCKVQVFRLYLVKALTCEKSVLTHLAFLSGFVYQLC